MSLAQIGEFAFVLLSRASNLHLVEVSVTVSVCHAYAYTENFLAKIFWISNVSGVLIVH